MEYWLQVFQNVLRTPGCAGHLHAPHTLPISCQYIHTLTQTTIKIWTYGLKFCMYSSYPSCTTHTAHKWRTPTHLLAASTCPCCKHHDHQPKNTETKMEKWEVDLELWYTHYLAHHLTGARNTNYLTYPVLSQQSLTFKHTPVAVELERKNLCCHVSIFAIFDTTPRSHHKQIFFWRCVSKMIEPLVPWIFIKSKKCPNSK